MRLALLLLAVNAFGQEIRLEQIATGISAPTDIQNAGDGSGRLFFVQQNGVIRIFRNGALVSQPFLDIRSKTTGTGERGLLGLAFPPGFAQKQRFYVDYTDLNGNTVIAQYRVTSNPDIADPASEIALLHITQPFDNHNGGQVRFGPDGYLYIAMGDGGSGGDPMGNGQSLNTLLAKILRIDVESNPGSVVIPSTNPFVSRAGARPEIWAYGLRNPWRFSFDRATNDLYIADVGQETYEEVNFQPAGDRGGEDYGWNRMEGMHCYQSGCTTDGLTLPVTEYTHAAGCSIIGGFVYRGRVSPGLRGTYIYGDLCSGTIWGLDRLGGDWASRVLLNAAFTITTFGEDEAGEVYVANADRGTIQHIIGSAAPRFQAAGAVNAASFAAGLAPGSAATIFGAGFLDDAGVVSAQSIPLPQSLGDLSVTVNGVAAPLYAVANVNGSEQVNFQVPFEAAGRQTASVVVTRAGRSSAAVNVPIVSPQPGIYTSGGTQAIVVHNADNTLVTAARPLAPNEFVYLYASALGGVTNQPPTGAAAPSGPFAEVSNVSVKLAGVNCEVQFGGLAPALVGVYQVNFRVPANAASGSQEIVVNSGGVDSPRALVPVGK
ncbi:MAG TPA: PQQ-dependent sugar dehydrogenase [Bryobacteraceae bacterium]|jgi:uncharacterized protein (TIGR03437 family)